MRKIYFYVILLIGFCVNAQVSIGNNIPDQSAILELNTTNISPKKGFLPPRVQLLNNKDITTIANPVVGMTAYNKLAAGTSPNIIDANSFVVWDGSTWQKISNLPEIKSLKLPKDFATVSTTAQNFTTTSQLSTVNALTPVEVYWSSGDVKIDNPTDVQLETNKFKFLKSSYFQISGMVTFKTNTASASSDTQIVLAVQKLEKGATIWTNIFSNTLPIQQYASGKSQTLTIPNIIHQFNIDDELRVVIFKPAGKTNYSTDSGIIGRNTTDIVKSLRILRINQ